MIICSDSVTSNICPCVMVESFRVTAQPTFSEHWSQHQGKAPHQCFCYVALTTGDYVILMSAWHI